MINIVYTLQKSHSNGKKQATKNMMTISN